MTTTEWLSVKGCMGFILLWQLLSITKVKLPKHLNANKNVVTLYPKLVSTFVSFLTSSIKLYITTYQNC